MPTQTLSGPYGEDARFSPCKRCVIQERLEQLEDDKPNNWAGEQVSLREFCPCEEARMYDDEIADGNMVAQGSSIPIENVETISEIVEDFVRELGFDNSVQVRNMSSEELEIYLANRMGKYLSEIKPII